MRTRRRGRGKPQNTHKQTKPLVNTRYQHTKADSVGKVTHFTDVELAAQATDGNVRNIGGERTPKPKLALDDGPGTTVEKGHSSHLIIDNGTSRVTSSTELLKKTLLAELENGLTSINQFKVLSFPVPVVGEETVCRGFRFQQVGVPIEENVVAEVSLRSRMCTTGVDIAVHFDSRGIISESGHSVRHHDVVAANLGKITGGVVSSCSILLHIRDNAGVGSHASELTRTARVVSKRYGFEERQRVSLKKFENARTTRKKEYNGRGAEEVCLVLRTPNRFHRNTYWAQWKFCLSSLSLARAKS